jgi:SPP1 family predicted phage head-tail adaptor
MRAGDLRDRITIDRAPKPWPQDDAMQPTPAWAEYGRPWADVQPISLRSPEAQSAGLTVALDLVTVRIRYSERDAAITADEQWRVTYKSRLYNIRNVDSRTKRHLGEITMLCEARADA